MLCLSHHEIPATLNFERLNPGIALDGSPLEVSTHHQPWEPPSDGMPRVAGVSSFGSGGSNAHVVVEEYGGEPACPPATEPRSRHLVVLSARTENGLRRREADLLAWLSAGGGRHRLADISATLALGRAHFDHRSAYVVASVAELEEKLVAAAGSTDHRAGRCAPLSGQLRDNSLIRRVTRLILDDLATSDVARGEAREDDLRALAELYVLGFDVEWHRLFYDTLEERVALPAYPFEKERYWLADSTGAREQPASAWCCLAEQWASAPLPRDLDWQRQLAALGGATVVVVYEDEDDREALMSLLRALMSRDAGGGRTAASLRAVHAREIAGGAAGAFDPLPDVVFCLGPRTGAVRSGAIGADPAATVFHVSRSLMQGGWEHAVRLYYIFDESASPRTVECEALAGFFRSAMLENRHHVWTLVAFRESGGEITRHQALLQEWLAGSPIDTASQASGRRTWCAVRYDGSRRAVRALVELGSDRGQSSDAIRIKSRAGASDGALARAGFRAGATYLVTGALGPVGEQLCEELAVSLRPTLVVFSRTSLDARRQQRIDRLESLGATVHYFPVDVGDRDALTRAFSAAKARVGEIHGVVHLARLVEDGLIASKRWASFERVLAAKVRGTVLLDELTAREPLELFVLFSSMAANGLRGGSDYAYAAAFQNAFARRRRRLERTRERNGRTIAFAWGPWAVDTYQQAGRTDRFASAGFDLIDIRDACRAIDLAAGHDDPVLYLLKVSDRRRVRQHMEVATDDPLECGDGAPWTRLGEELRALEGLRERGGDVAQADVVDLLARCDVESMPQSLVDRADRLLFGERAIAAPDPADGPIDVRRVLRVVVGDVLKLPDGYDEERTLQSLGLDSVSAMQLATRMEARLHVPVQARWFIELSTIPALAEYLSAQMAGRTVLPSHP
ncbi:MAG: SDR family NAD(P)-dependent oxidoreductase [Vicinamibacterales bacterium]